MHWMSENSHSSDSRYRNLVQNAHQNLCLVSGIRILPSLAYSNILIFIRYSIKALWNLLDVLSIPLSFLYYAFVFQFLGYSSLSVLRGDKTYKKGFLLYL